MKELAHASLAEGDASGWFERLYDAAGGDPAVVPWADLVPNPWLLWWLDSHSSLEVAGARALVVGCGLGDDAEHLASRGAVVTAFDLSPKAIAWCKARWPATRVAYEAADLLAAPDAWRGAFDFVFEAYTPQVFPPGSEERARSLDALPTFVRPNGVLSIVARGADALPAREAGPPWPLVRAEIDRAGRGLELLSFDDVDDEGTRRFVAAFRRPA